MALAITSQSDPSNQSLQSNDIKIQWEDMNPVLTSQTSSGHNKAQTLSATQSNHSNQNTVIESKTNSKDVNAGKVVSSGAVKGAIGGLSLYGVELAVDLAVTNMATAELGYAMSCDATGGLIGVGTALTVVAVHKLYTYHKRRVEKAKLAKQKKLNEQITVYNGKINDYNTKYGAFIAAKKELTEQEAKLNSYTFLTERSNANSKVIVAIGPTGYGKSLFCNRIMGDKDDIDNIEDNADADYIVGTTGNINAVTSDLNKVTKKIHIEYSNNSKKSFILSVVDTPGAFDTNGNDIHYQNKMGEYFRASGGINLFCIFFRFGVKMDANYKKLLKLYENFWGKNIWSRCVVVITHCDADSTKLKKKLKKGLPATLKSVKSDLKKISNGLCNNVPIYEFGEDNFEESTKKLLLSLNDPKSTFVNKFKCDNIKSPIDTSWAKMEKAHRRFSFIDREMKMLKTTIRESKSSSSDNPVIQILRFLISL